MGKSSAKKAPGKQQCVQYFSLLAKPASAAGEFVDTLGSFWDKCPADDKAKIFKCLVVEFRAIHDFGAGRKGAGMLVKEMDESGEGSLEPGVASGEEFVMPCPTPFLQYYYTANKNELEPTVRGRLFPRD